MRPFEVEIDGVWHRVTEVDDLRFKVERHTKGVGWSTAFEAVSIAQGYRIQEESPEPEITKSCERAIHEYVDNRLRILDLVPTKQLQLRVAEAVELIEQYGTYDGGHHKQWVLDQIARKLTGDNYNTFRAGFIEKDEDGDFDHWYEGTPP